MAEQSIKDVGVSPGLLVLDLGHQDFVEYLPYFGPDARVVVIYMPTQVQPLEVDLPVVGFSWPQPLSQVTVGVHDPDLHGLCERLVGAGIDPPNLVDETEELEGIELMPDADPDAPGTVLGLTCPSCGFAEMFVESLEVQQSLTRSYADARGLSWGFDQCEAHGGHPVVGGRQLGVLRCVDCLDTYIFDDNLNLERHLEELG
jgi:hypothetical protein